MVSKIRVGCTVSGATGELYLPEHDDPGESNTAVSGATSGDGVQQEKSKRRRRRKRRSGTVIESVGYNKWLILWDDNMERSIHASNILKFEADGDSIRRGTMPPASSVVGVGAFASIAQTAAASTHLRTALPTMPPPASLVPTPAGPRPLE